MPLSYESLEAVNKIFDDAITRGKLTAEEKEKLSQILEVEDDFADIEISTAQESGAALEEYAKGLDTVSTEEATK